MVASGLKAAARADEAAARRMNAASGTPLGSSSVAAGGSSPHASPAIDRSAHFELFACDLVVSECGRVSLMEVNINCAFGSFNPRTEALLVRPLFDDLLSLCVLPAIGGMAPRAGRWRLVRPAGFESKVEDQVAVKELQEHQCYIMFKKSARKKYERQFAESNFLLSDVAREETPKEVGKCLVCSYFACRCASRP